MTPSDETSRRRERELFEHAVELDDGALEVFLLQLRAEDPAMAERIGRLLDADRDSGVSFLDEPIGGGVSAAALEDPDTIGEYRILERIGEGGMGVVYLAEQSRPVRRKVAIKVVKVGMDTADLLARFDSERQALALMNHPNIAGIYDAGATDAGRPYFVMEYVAGRAITRYCDDNALGIDARLTLFLEACDAVAHAHQKGVIHRDIKPENILVAEEDRRSRPKVIDFGIAKSVDDRLTDRPAYTRIGGVIGTADYMSPEQAAPQPGGIDTRSDIYSLGAVLHELLLGVPPAAKGRSEADTVRLIQRAKDLESAQIEEAARARQTTPSDLVSELDGELSWIVAKALAPDPSNRYQSAREFAGDIRAFLKLEPLLAGPDTLAYRLKSYARRNRVAVFSTMVVVLALGIGMALSVAGFIEANRERDIARRAQDESEAVTRFLADMLSAADPSKDGRDVTVREVLGDAEAQVRSDFGDRPLLAARLLGTIGETYLELGMLAKAENTLSESSTLYGALLAETDPVYLDSVFQLGRIYQRVGRYDEAVSAYERVYAGRREVLGENSLDTVSVLNNLGVVFGLQGRHVEALEVRERVHDLRTELAGELASETLTAKNNLALSYETAGRNAEAIRLFREAVAGRTRVFGIDHPATLMVRSNLAGSISRSGNRREAIAMLTDVVADATRVFGADDWRTLISRHSLARSKGKAGLNDQAEQEFLAVIAAREQVLGEHHPETQMAHVHYSEVLMQMGRADEAVPRLETAVSASMLSLADDSPVLAQHRVQLGTALLAIGRLAEAEEVLMQAYPVLKKNVDQGSVAMSGVLELALSGLIEINEESGELLRGEQLRQEIDELRSAHD